MLFIMRGASCSGKTTFIKNNFPDYENHVISSDNFRELYLGTMENQQYNDFIFSKVREALEWRLINKVQWTVIDATNLRIKDSAAYIDLCKRFHTNFTFMSICPPDIEEMKVRNKDRALAGGLNVPDGVLEKHHRRYFDCMPAFLEEADNNRYCSFIEVDQNGEVILDRT